MRPQLVRDFEISEALLPAQTLKPTYERTLARVKAAHATHLGYPYNLNFEPGVPTQFGNYLINNLGDPYVGSHYASEVCDLEREAVSWLMDLWECDCRAAFAIHRQL